LVIKYAQENNLDYIDLNPFIASDSLEIKDEYTTDGLHLSAAAYLVWAREITTVLKKYGI
jgi:lysophospholipase L1-like esterase